MPNVVGMKWPTDEDRVEALQRFLVGLARGDDANPLSCAIADLHVPRQSSRKRPSTTGSRAGQTTLGVNDTSGSVDGSERAEESNEVHLGRVVVDTGVGAVGPEDRGLADFLIATETTRTAMDDDAAQADSLAVLIGRPMALVRVAVDIATPPTDSNPDNGDDIRSGTGTSSPVGLVGVWVDTPSTADASNNFGLFRSADDGVVRMDRSVTRVIVSMLIDPGRCVHVASGLLPAVELSLEPDQYSAALKQIETSFRAAPTLTDTGGEWSWVQEGSPDDAGFTD